MNRPMKVPDSIRADIIEYILDIVKHHGKICHYSRARHRDDTIYISKEFSIRAMWEGFIALHQPFFWEAVSRAHQKGSSVPRDRNDNKITALVLQKCFTLVFNDNFGFIKFFTPKTDECGTFLTLRTKIRMEKDRNANNVAIPFLEKDIQEHLEYSELSYSAVTADIVSTTESRQKFPQIKSQHIDVIVIDFMKTVDIPRLVVKDVRFKDQLSCHVFDIYDGATDRHHFYMYDKNHGGTGPNELISIILRHLDSDLMKLTLGPGALMIWADNCAGQNKNQFLCAFFMEMSRSK